MAKKAWPLMLVFLVTTLSLRAEGISDIRKASCSGQYEEPPASVLMRSEKLFARLFAGDGDLAAMSSTALELNMEIVSVSQSREDFLVLKEAGCAKRGLGLYVFRRRNFIPVAIEAPHSSDDLDTGELAELFFLESKVAAVAWNTAPRSLKLSGKADLADLAHLPESVFQSFTRALAKVHPAGIVIQLHGFDQNCRETKVGTKSDIILSNGTRSPPAWLIQMKPCLETGLSESVSVFPRDIAELGAMTNTQNKLLQGLGHHGFLHLEMSLPLRRQLKRSAELRKAFWRCVPEKQP